MAEAVLKVLEVAVRTLYTVYKNHKDSKRELKEVGYFLLDLRANSPIFTTKIDRLKHAQNTLQGKLESARKQVEEWSSRNPDFFHSDERLRKIRGIHQKVKDAMDEAHGQYLAYIADGVNELLILQRKEMNVAVPAKRPTPAKLNVQPSKPHPSNLGAQGIAKTSPRSKSTPGRAVLPSKAIASTPRRDKIVELYVPMDSDKQARDVVEKLKALRGVKKAYFDQTLKKVWVEPLEGFTLNTDQLLQNAQLKNKSVAPTLWSKRPR